MAACFTSLHQRRNSSSPVCSCKQLVDGQGSAAEAQHNTSVCYLPENILTTYHMSFHLHNLYKRSCLFQCVTGQYQWIDWNADEERLNRPTKRLNLLWEISQSGGCMLFIFTYQILDMGDVEWTWGFLMLFSVVMFHCLSENTVSTADLSLDKQDRTGTPRQSQNHSPWLFIWEASTLCSEGTDIHHLINCNSNLNNQHNFFG